MTREGHRQPATRRDLEHVVHHLDNNLAEGLAVVIEEIRRIPAGDHGDGLLSQYPIVSEVHGRSTTMAAPEIVPVPKIKDVEKVLLSTMPRKADGTIAVDAPEGWSSSTTDIGFLVGTEPFDFDDGERGIVTCPGHFNCWALTPGLQGAGSIFSKRGEPYRDAEFQISYAEGVALSQNPSVGSPVPDTDGGI